MKILAIIPARGGSKGIPNKNIQNVGGKPLIARTIEVALQSDIIDRIIVSTDDQKIKDISHFFMLRWVPYFLEGLCKLDYTRWAADPPGLFV